MFPNILNYHWFIRLITIAEVLFCYSESRQQESGAGLYDRVLAKHTRAMDLISNTRKKESKREKGEGEGKREGRKEGGRERDSHFHLK